MAGRRLVFKLYLVADELYEFLRGASRVGARDDLQRDARPLLAANLADGFFHGLPHDVFHLAVFLLDADYLVASLYPAVEIDGAARHYLGYLQGAVVHLQHRAHAAEREVHVHVEVLLVGGRHVVGVGIVRPRDGGEIVLENRLFVLLRQDREILAVLLDEVLLVGEGGVDLVLVLSRLAGVLLAGVLLAGGLLGLVDFAHAHHSELFVLDALAPEFARVLLVLGPWRVLAADPVRFVRGEIPLRRRYEVRRVADALAEPLAEEVVHVVAERDVARPQFVVEGALALREHVEVALQEDRVVEIVVRHEIRPGAARNLVVERLLQDVVARQHRAQPPRYAAVVSRRRGAAVAARACRRRKRDERRGHCR